MDETNSKKAKRRKKTGEKRMHIAVELTIQVMVEAR